ncbi:MAG: ATP-binding protein [Eubacterium sp.]|nr:ATP-binding protein [Eubacterium sp.]MBQ9229540.1 ATP-binding protein [Eubacterium sp.]
MKELSLNILDVAENSVKAGAALTEILIEEDETQLTLRIRDNGCGMTEEQVRAVIDPFYTTRTTRSVGLGVPLLKLAAEQTGGSFTIESKAQTAHPDSHGTTVTARFHKQHIDYTPLGDVAASVVTLIQGHPDADFYFCHKTAKGQVTLDTRELRQVLEGVPLNTYDVIKWMEEYLQEQYLEIKE